MSKNRVSEKGLLAATRIPGSKVFNSVVRRKPEINELSILGTPLWGTAGLGRYLGDNRILLTYKYNPFSELGRGDVFVKLEKPKTVTRKPWQILRAVETEEKKKL